PTPGLRRSVHAARGSLYAGCTESSLRSARVQRDPREVLPETWLADSNFTDVVRLQRRKTPLGRSDDGFASLRRFLACGNDRPMREAVVGARSKEESFNLSPEQEGKGPARPDRLSLDYANSSAKKNQNLTRR